MTLLPTRPSDVLRLRRLLMMGWMLGVTFIFLFTYGNWVILPQFIHLTIAVIPHLSIGPHFGAFLRERLLDGLWLLALCAAAFPVGALIVTRFTERRDGLMGLFALATGLWVVATLTLGIGVISVGHVGWVFLLLLGWALPTARSFPRPRWPTLDAWEWGMVIVISVVVLLSLPGACAPPFEYDELEYHLGAPMDYIRAGRIVFLPHNFYSNLPQLTEMPYLLALVTRSDVAAKLLHGLFGLLAAMVTGWVGARLWSRRVGLTAAALFYCLPFVQDLNHTARVDLATTFFGVLAFGGLLVDDERASYLSALVAGAAVATKWPAIAVVFLPCLLFLLWSRRSPQLAIRYGLLVGVMVLPWLVKNWMLAGNPVYPLLSHSSLWTSEQAALFARKHYATFADGAWMQAGERLWRYSFTELMAVPLLLLTAPLAVVVAKRDGKTKCVAILFGLAYAGWFLTTFRPWRFLFPALPLATLLGAWALEKLGREAKVVVVVTMVMALLLMAQQPLIDTEDPGREIPQLSLAQYALGAASREEFVGRVGRSTFEPIIWMNQNLPSTARVLYVGEARAYYAQHRALWSTVFDQHPLESRPDYTHVYVNYSELKRLRESYSRLRGEPWDSFLPSLNHTLHHGGPGVVFER